MLHLGHSQVMSAERGQWPWLHIITGFLRCGWTVLFSPLLSSLSIRELEKSHFLPAKLEHFCVYDWNSLSFPLTWTISFLFLLVDYFICLNRFGTAFLLTMTICLRIVRRDCCCSTTLNIPIIERNIFYFIALIINCLCVPVIHWKFNSCANQSINTRGFEQLVQFFIRCRELNVVLVVPQISPWEIGKRFPFTFSLIFNKKSLAGEKRGACKWI